MIQLSIKAGYLPPQLSDTAQWHTLHFETSERSLTVEVPRLDRAQLTTLANCVRAGSRQFLKTLPVSGIVEIIDRAIARLLDPADPLRREAESLLPLVTGFDAEMIRLSLSSYLKTFRGPQLHRFVTEDFSNAKLLDEFAPRPKGGWAKAIGPDLLVHVWAGNVPGLPLWSLVSGLLVKAGSIGKVSSAEPLFAGWFARLLVDIEPRLANCMGVVWWQGGDPVLEQHLFQQADVVLAYGGNVALEQIGRQIPVTTRYLPHGHKLSFGMVSASALDVRGAQHTAHAAALDVARYDQQACYSPQLFYVARGGRVSPREFAALLAGELACLQQKFARRHLQLDEANSVASWRQSQELKTLAGSDAQLLGEADAGWSVAYSERAIGLVPSALYRTLQVVAVDDLHEVAALVADQRAYLQTVGLAAAPEELFVLAEALGQAGVTRICAIGAMTAPEAGWHHDGRFSLLDLVRIVAIDQSTELAAESFAAYRD